MAGRQAHAAALQLNGAADVCMVELYGAAGAALCDVNAGGAAFQGNGAVGIDNRQAGRSICAGAGNISIDRTVKHSDERCPAGVLHRLKGRTVVAYCDSAGCNRIHVTLCPGLDIAGARRWIIRAAAGQVEGLREDDGNFCAGYVVIGTHLSMVVAGHDSGCGAFQHGVGVPAAVEVGIGVVGPLLKSEHF